jgi:16S rRNA (uracil1498-N3)-methyltransferase
MSIIGTKKDESLTPSPSFLTSTPHSTIPADCTISLEHVPWRPRLGEIITVRDAAGGFFRGRVFSTSEYSCNVRLFEYLEKGIESQLNILLLQALPEKERMEWIVQKGTELGVYAIVPYYSEHSTTVSERDKKQRKAHRWPIIAQKAAQQCRRAILPIIAAPANFSQALLYARGYDIKILLSEKEQHSHFKNQFTRESKPSKVALLVGPEGGFAESEIDIAMRAGFCPIRLGPRILRTETAAIAIISIVQYLWGDLG